MHEKNQYFINTQHTCWVHNFISYSDQYQYLGNCPLTPPLTQQKSIDNKLGLMLG